MRLAMIQEVLSVNVESDGSVTLLLVVVVVTPSSGGSSTLSRCVLPVDVSPSQVPNLMRDAVKATVLEEFGEELSNQEVLNIYS